ncbi:MAG: ATP-binding protein [Dehalococcoidales bacterium]|nr:ATP-binding protein [Dehalococcoidales bacterium]
MEHIGEILKKQARTGTSRASTDTWSSADDEAMVSPDCPICKGAGIVHPRLPSGQPDYSRVVPCKCTRREQDSERLTRLTRYSNLGALTRFTFDTLEPRGRSGSKASQERFSSACEAARQYAAEPEGWLVLGGTSGSGKTHLAAAIVNERIKNGYPALYVTAPDLLDHLRSSFEPDSEVPYSEFFEQVRSAPLLVLDDLGAQSGTPFAREKLDQLLTSRYNAQLPTVIVAITPIDQMDDRLRTRLTDERLCRVFVLEEEQPTSEYGWSHEFELQKKMTFINYKRRNDLSMEQQDNMDEAYRIAFDFARNPEGWLVFMGETGCGKTHLAAAIVNFRYEAGKPALFVVVPDFLDHLRSAFSPESKVSYDKLFESVKSAPLLVLDDFGEQSTTPWAKEKLYQVLNYRYNAQLPTVITTRYSFDEIIEQFDSSVSSRLVDKNVSVPFFIMAPDFRGDATHGRKRTPRGRTRSNR